MQRPASARAAHASDRLAFGDQLVHQPHLVQRRRRHDERVQVGVAHRPVDHVQGPGHRNPEVDDLVQAAGPVEAVAQAGRGRGDPERGGGVEGVADVQVVREGLGPVLGRVHRGVGRDEGGGPVRRRPLRVVAVDGGLVVGVGVAEQPLELGPGRPLRGQHLVEVVPDLVAEVPEHGAVRLVHRLAQLLAVGVVALGQIEGDHAGVVTGDHAGAGAGEQVERHPVPLVEGQAASGSARARPARTPAVVWPLRHRRIRSARPGPGRRAGCGSACTTRTGRRVDEAGATQLQTARILFRQRHRSGGCSIMASSSETSTNSRRARSMPTPRPQARQREFSNANREPQFGHEKSRIAGGVSCRGGCGRTAP